MYAECLYCNTLDVPGKSNVNFCFYFLLSNHVFQVEISGKIRLLLGVCFILKTLI